MRQPITSEFRYRFGLLALRQFAGAVACAGQSGFCFIFPSREMNPPEFGTASSILVSIAIASFGVSAGVLI